MIFAFVLQIMLSEKLEYGDIWESIKSVFEMSMGQFEFSYYDDIYYIHKWIPQVVVFVLIAITHITLLNFVIAILSNTYEKLT